MTQDERKTVLIAEMRLAGVPSEVVNYYRTYLFKSRLDGKYIDEDEVRSIIHQHERGDGFKGWLAAYGHHFEDADNLPKDESWTKE
jgi:hypothetical protein